MVYRLEGLISIHPPLVGWDFSGITGFAPQADFNPPTPCGVGPPCHGKSGNGHRISIHPPLVGWDSPPWPVSRPQAISIHPPLVGWDFQLRNWQRRKNRFQSTHPLWGGTDISGNSGDDAKFQSTHPLWGGTYRSSRRTRDTHISIHPPLVGWDMNASMCTRTICISIHPPLVGWDEKAQGR